MTVADPDAGLVVMEALVQEFRTGLFTSNSGPAVGAFKQLITHLENQYINDVLLPATEPASRVKKIIINFFLSLRVNHLAQVGLADAPDPESAAGPVDQEIDYSPFVICGSSDLSLRCGSFALSPPLTPSILMNSLLVKLTELSLTDMFRVLLLALEKEKDWQILRLLLTGLRDMVSQNPTMIIMTKSFSRSPANRSGSRSVAGDIVSTAAQLINDKGRSPDHLVNVDSAKFTKSEFDRYVYPLLESLIVYGKELEPNYQTELIKSIQVGLQNRSHNRHTMLALTSCLMEMQDQKVVKYLPELLLSISKISATKALAVPKMSFLSTLVLFPHMYSSFTADQYMSIFAIAIPYTNYSEFDEFTIALAHRVIAMWFLNCKLEARMQFASYIRKNLVQNLQHSISSEDEMRTRSHSVGTSMKRSPDYTYARIPQTPIPHVVHPHHVPLPASPGHTLSPAPHAPHSASSNTIFFSEASLSGAASTASVSVSGSRVMLSGASRETLHRELFEACMDLLSRYTHGMCSSVPRKNPLAEFIIDRETATTWLVGQSLITIAVSHCSGKVTERGLCKKCNEICNSVTTTAALNKTTTTVGVTAAGTSDTESDSTQLTCSTESAAAPSIRNGKNCSVSSGSRISESQRRRHQSAIDNRPLGAKPQSRAYDDIHLEASVSSAASASTASSSLTASSQNENCSCWCQGWAEITERRPTGKTSFMMRIENSLTLPCYGSSSSSTCHAGLVRFYDPRILSATPAARSVGHQVQNEGQKSHTTSTNQMQEVAATSSSGSLTSGGSSSSGAGDPGSSFRRTSSSPEIEHNNIMNQVEENEVEEAKEAKDDDVMLGSSPTKGLARTVSLGKAEKLQRPSWTRGANKNGLTINLQEANSVYQNGTNTSPTKSSSRNSPKSPVDEQSNGHHHHHSGSTSPASLRERSHTFSANTMMMQNKKQPVNNHSSTSSGQSRHPMHQRQSVHPDTHTKSTGLSASFFFLRLFYNPSFSQNHHTSHESESPILLPAGSDNAPARSIRLLDLLTPFETHKIGVLYVAPGQRTKDEILRNEHGSVRYQFMLGKIANLVRLKDVDQEMCFIGGLDNANDVDGKYAYCWADHLTQVVFHVATLMPSKERDPDCNDKFRHIGNDFVCIVYNESGRPFCRADSFDKVPFLKVCIVITPMDCGVNSVEVQAETDSERITGLPEKFLITDNNLSLYVRQIAIHANLAFRQQFETAKRAHGDMPFVSNWVERLRHMKRLRNVLAAGHSGSPATSSMDFENHRPRSMTTATRDMIVQQHSSDGQDSEYPDDFTKFTG